MKPPCHAPLRQEITIFNYDFPREETSLHHTKCQTLQTQTLVKLYITKTELYRKP